MAYTASALAFLLADLPKPVVLTGAQIPLCEYSSDATNNFRGALLSAGMKDLPGESGSLFSFVVTGVRLETSSLG
jgi:L-asparaginase/Glu-tRNA(Gln) amidotransferase subunit D